MQLKKFIFLWILIVYSLPSWSQKTSNTLDFGADIIEGELKKPQLFVELGANIEDMTSIIHLRDNFNDFHAIDQKRRLRFIKK